MNRFAFLLISRVIFIFIILISFITFYSGAKEYNTAKLLIENGIITKAVVIDVGKKYVELPKYSGYVYQPIFEYFDLENNKIKFIHNSPVNSISIIHQLGDTLEIVYYADKSNKERENSFGGLYGIAFGAFFGGSIFFSVGLWGFIYLWKYKLFI